MKIIFNNGKQLQFHVHKARSMKRIASLGIVLTVLTASTVMAGTTSATVNSTGKVIYNNADGTQVVIDSNDIQENRTAIQKLENQTSGLNGNLVYKNGSYYVESSDGTDSPIGAVGDATADMVLTGHTFSSASAGVNASGAMDIPTLLTLGTCTGSDNDGISSNVTIDNKYGQTENNDEIDLGIGDSITIPAGYYDKPLTINNSVINRGTFNPSSSIVGNAGYYSLVSSKEAFDAGLASYVMPVIPDSDITELHSLINCYNQSGSVSLPLSYKITKSYSSIFVVSSWQYGTCSNVYCKRDGTSIDKSFQVGGYYGCVTCYSDIKAGDIVYYSPRHSQCDLSFYVYGIE